MPGSRCCWFGIWLSALLSQTSCSVEPPVVLPTPTNASRGLTPAERPTAASGVTYRERFAVIVGIDAYSADEGLPPLQFACNDAREVQEVLCQEFGYKPDNVRFLLDGQATQSAVREAFENWLPGRALDQNDSVLVFFSGHGLMDRADAGHLALADSRAKDLAGSCLSVAWIKSQLERLPSRHKCVILDSCYSGSLFLDDQNSAPPAAQLGESIAATRGSRQAGSGTGASAHDNFHYYYSRTAFLGMSAGRLTPVADGLGRNRHSVFTSALLDALRRRAGSPRSDQAFTFRQLAGQVEAHVAAAQGSRQLPQWGLLARGDGDFVFTPVVERKSRIRFALPEGMQVQWAVEGGHIASSGLTTPAQFPFGQGWEYRLKFSNIPEFPGLEVYSTLGVAAPEQSAALGEGALVPMSFTEQMMADAREGQKTTLVMYQLDQSLSRPALQMPPRDDLLQPLDLSTLSPSTSGETQPEPNADPTDPFAEAEPTPKPSAQRSLLDEVLAEEPLLNDPALNSKTLKGRIAAEVERGIAEAQELAKGNPQDAEQLVKLLLENVEAAPDLDVESRQKFRTDLETAIRLFRTAHFFNVSLEELDEVLDAPVLAWRRARGVLSEYSNFLIDPSPVSRQCHILLRYRVDYLNDRLNSSLVQTASSSEVADPLVEAEARGTILAVLKLGGWNVALDSEPGAPVQSPIAADLATADAPCRYPLHLLSAEQRREADGQQFHESIMQMAIDAMDYTLQGQEDDAILLLQQALLDLESSNQLANLKKAQTRHFLVDLLEQALEPKADANYRQLVRFRGKLRQVGGIELIETPLSDVADQIDSMYGIRVEFDERALSDSAVSLDTPVTTSPRSEVSLREQLRRTLATLDLVMVPAPAGILITTEVEAADEFVTAMYPVIDLVDGEDPESADQLIRRICRFVASDTWSEGADGGSFLGNSGDLGEIEYIPGRHLLAVRQSWPVHLELLDFLTKLRGRDDEP